jgi:uncharacterized protein involved in exopolysaccharide biosynthesis
MANFRPRSIGEIAQVVWRRRLLVLVVATVVATAATITILSIPRLYESRALVVVSGAIYDRNANGAQIASVTEQMTSRSNLEKLVTRYSLYPATERMDLRVQNLQDDIKFETKYRSDSQGFPESFAISYRTTDPATAQRLVGDLVSIFDTANSTLERQANDEAQRIKSEIAAIESKLARSGREKAVSNARSSAAARSAAAVDRLRSERNAVAASVEQLKDRQYALDRQISDQRRLIAQQQELVKTSAPAPDDSRASSYGALLKRKAELETQIQDYSTRFTDKYPKVVAAREQLADINSQLAQAGSSGEQTRASATSPAAQELRNLERELSRMQTELDVVQRELSRKLQAASVLPGGAAASLAPVPSARTLTAASDSGEPLDYTTDTLRERYTSLLRREEALRDFTPSAAGPVTQFFQTVDPPGLPQAPAAPRRSKLMIIALVLALGSGLLAAAVSELSSVNRIYDERDVNYFLGVPLLAQIPESLTVTEQSAKRQRLQMRSAVYVLLGIVAVPVLTLLLNASRIFQILGYRQ